MFYRILKAPPGYQAHQMYMLAAYTTLEFNSCRGGVQTVDGSIFFATLEEARTALPQGARQLPFELENQFLELWESP